jgi:hypothetical protein
LHRRGKPAINFGEGNDRGDRFCACKCDFGLGAVAFGGSGAADFSWPIKGEQCVIELPAHAIK